MPTSPLNYVCLRQRADVGIGPYDSSFILLREKM